MGTQQEQNKDFRFYFISEFDLFRFLLAQGAKNAAAVGLVQQVLEAPGVYVFGELLDHPNIKDLETNTSTPNAKAYHDLLNLFVYGTFEEYLSAQPQLPALTEPMKKKLRLLTIATIATKEKTIKYEHMQRVLGIDSIRELEDLNTRLRKGS